MSKIRDKLYLQVVRGYMCIKSFKDTSYIILVLVPSTCAINSFYASQSPTELVIMLVPNNLFGTRFSL